MKLLPAQLITAAGGREHAGRDHGGCTSTRPRPRAAGGIEWKRHGRGQPDDDPGEHALEAHRPRDRAGNAAINWHFKVATR